MLLRLLILGLCVFAVPAMAAPLLPWQKADQVVVEKARRTLTLMAKGQPLKRYYISLGGMPVGAKRQQGDEKTPEGEYIIDAHRPRSNYYKAMHISYPNAQDMADAKKRGVDPGGDIMIHGLSQRMKPMGERHRFYDWTNGCIAVTNSEMDELWHAIDDGTPIIIKP